MAHMAAADDSRATVSNEAPPDPQRQPQARRGRWRFRIAIAILIAAFVGTIWKRDAIRARWWAYRLVQSDDLNEQAGWITAIEATGPAGLGAARYLAKSDRAAIRSMAVAVLGHCSNDGAIRTLGALVRDPDRDVRESAALTLAFSGHPLSRRLLIDHAAASDSDAAAAAVSGLARVATVEAQSCLVHALRSHGDPLVRAQAAESLADNLAIAGVLVATADPVSILLRSQEDDGVFRGQLVAEREIERVTGHVAMQTATTLPVENPDPTHTPRRVGDIATVSLCRLTSLSADELHRLIDKSANPAEAIGELMEARRRQSSPPQ